MMNVRRNPSPIGGRGQYLWATPYGAIIGPVRIIDPHVRRPILGGTSIVAIRRAPPRRAVLALACGIGGRRARGTGDGSGAPHTSTRRHDVLGGDTMRKVIVTLAIAAALIGGMFVVSPSGASAQGGCKEFGQAVRAAAQQPGPFGQTVKQ